MYSHIFQLLPTKLPHASTSILTLPFYCKFAMHLMGISQLIQQSQWRPQKIKQKKMLQGKDFCLHRHAAVIDIELGVVPFPSSQYLTICLQMVDHEQD